MVAPAVSFTGDVTRGGQPPDDAARGRLGHSKAFADVAQADACMARDANQEPGMVRQEAKSGHGYAAVVAQEPAPRGGGRSRSARTERRRAAGNRQRWEHRRGRRHVLDAVSRALSSATEKPGGATDLALTCAGRVTDCSLEQVATPPRGRSPSIEALR
jgi:hypothetical protein